MVTTRRMNQHFGFCYNFVCVLTHSFLISTPKEIIFAAVIFKTKQFFFSVVADEYVRFGGIQLFVLLVMRIPSPFYILVPALFLSYWI